MSVCFSFDHRQYSVAVCHYLLQNHTCLTTRNRGQKEIQEIRNFYPNISLPDISTQERKCYTSQWTDSTE